MERAADSMADYEVRDGYFYTQGDTWVRLDDGVLRIGITDYAQKQLKEIEYLNLPDEGDRTTQGQTLGEVESKKTVSDLLSPLTGTVREINEAAVENPAALNSAPYDVWILSLNCPDFEAQTAQLMSPEQYRAYRTGK